MSSPRGQNRSRTIMNIGPLTRAMAMAVAALGAGSCGRNAAASLNPIVLGKCVFDEGRFDRIEPGDIFIYALRNDDGSGLRVATGKAEASDPLTDRVVRQPIKATLPARIVPIDRLEFGGLAEDGSGKHEFFVSKRNSNGEVTTSIGGTYGTSKAYPLCAFWE